MGEILYEYRRETVRTGPPILGSVGLSNYTFRSVFGYPVDTANFIKDNGHTRDLKGKPVYCDEILIDVDEDSNVDLVIEKVKALKIGCDVYFTGNRGIHIHVPIVPILGEFVPYSVVEWLKSVELWQLIDQSTFTPGSIFRCIGATHSKTGAEKDWADAFEGELLEIPVMVPPPIPTLVDELEVVESELETYFRNLMRKAPVGGRHPHMFIIWKSGRSAGFDEETVKESIRVWNDQQEQPHDEESLQKSLRTFK